MPRSPAAGTAPWLRRAMSSASLSRPAWWMPALFGVWAAAIALSPGLPLKAALAAPAVIAPVLWWTFQNPGRWLALFCGAAILLPPLPIPLGDSGPHPALLFAAMGLLAGVMWLAEWRFLPTGLNAAFLTLTLMARSGSNGAFVFRSETNSSAQNSPRPRMSPTQG